VRVATHWDHHRVDWLLGTTLRAPQATMLYEHEGVRVHRIGLSRSVRRRLVPWVAAYYALQGPALRRIAAAIADEVRPLADGVDIVHNCRIGREGLTAASLQLARERRLPFVLTPVHHPRWSGWLHRHYQRLYREADAVIALTSAEREVLAGLGVARDRLFVTGHGPILAVSPDGARYRALRGWGDEPVVLFLGQKYAYKGVAALREAASLVWRTYPDARFAFVGPRTDHSRRLFARETDPRIHEADAVDLQEKTDALAACDVLCLPSTQESFGGTFTEAWSLGRPVLGADIPAVREVVDDGTDGFLVSPTPAAIAERLVRLLSDPVLRRQMGDAGRAKVDRLYSWPLLARKTEEVYAAARRRLTRPAPAG
jgi:glycosyltransferase involved in cell wall biosynthesis